MREKNISKIFIFLKVFILFLAAVCSRNPDELLFPLLQTVYVILLKFGDKLKGEQWCILKKYSSFCSRSRCLDFVEYCQDYYLSFDSGFFLFFHLFHFHQLFSFFLKLLLFLCKLQNENNDERFQGAEAGGGGGGGGFYKLSSL